MTIEEYHRYAPIVLKLFQFMNGRINTLNNNCQLELNMFDMVNGTYGNIRFPNTIIINIGTVIDSWNDDWYEYMDKHDYIGTCLAWAIAHELHHADQLISMIQYNRNQSYKSTVETDVEQASHKWVADHAKEISMIGGFRVVIQNIETPDLRNGRGNYTKVSVKEFYLQTIANVILRDFDAYRSLKVFEDDTIADNIIIKFANENINLDSVAIKLNGTYLKDSLNAFSELSYMYAGYYDLYSVNASVEFDIRDTTTAIVTFSFSNRLINPMIFAK